MVVSPEVGPLDLQTLPPLSHWFVWQGEYGRFPRDSLKGRKTVVGQCLLIQPKRSEITYFG